MAKLADAYVELRATSDKLKSDFNKAKQMTESTANSMKSTFMKIGGAIGLAFGVQQLVAFGKEAVELAAKLEGVRAAFNQLNNPQLLKNLQQATRNTVSDLLLMQTAVKAENFRIPMETLVKGLEFAQKKATQTGQSVDYLVDSLITGIGRKSLPILDNLQLSIVEIQEEVKKTGDFGKAVGAIIERELKKMGNVALTTADRLAQLNTKWENMKVVVGEGIIDVFASFERLASNTYGWLSKIAQLPANLLGRLGIDISDKGLGITKEPKTSGGSMKDLQAQILAENARTKAAEEQLKLEKEKEKTAEGIKKKIMDLLTANDLLNVSSAEYLANLKKIKELEESLDPIAKSIAAAEKRKADEALKRITGVKQTERDLTGAGKPNIFLETPKTETDTKSPLESVKEFEQGRIDLATEANRIIGTDYGQVLTGALNQSASIATRLSNVLSLGAHTFVAQMANALNIVSEIVGIISSIIGLINTFSNPVGAVVGAATGGVSPQAPASNNSVRALNLNQQNSRPIEIPVYVNGVELTRQVVIPNIDDINKTGFKSGNS